MAQKSITSFFKPLQDNKRKLSEEILKSNTKLSNDDPPNKKICNDPAKSTAISTGKNTGIFIQEQIDRFSKATPALSSNIGHSWFQALKAEFSQSYFKTLSDFIVEERKKKTIYPSEDEVFSWTQFCKINEVKVIILGQDPYHGPKQAHGIAFSVKKGVTQPPSLVNIFKEVKNNYPAFEIPKHGELTEWSKQGVLMLNACLTVQAANANSHANKGWEKLTDAVIKHINDNYRNRVFLLWGAYAQKKGAFIDKKKHLVLMSVHPSPLSAHRGFIGCEHFKRANDYLNKNSLPSIDWTKLD